jgi:hypothetical protein
MTRSSSRPASRGVNELLALRAHILINGVIKGGTTFGYANNRGCMRAKTRGRRVGKRRDGKTSDQQLAKISRAKRAPGGAWRKFRQP